MSIPWLPVFFKNPFLFIPPAILGSPVCGSNGLTVSIFPRFLSTLPDAFTRPLEKMCEILNKISHRRETTAKNIFNTVALHTPAVGGF